MFRKLIEEFGLGAFIVIVFPAVSLALGAWALFVWWMYSITLGAH